MQNSYFLLLFLNICIAECFCLLQTLYESVKLLLELEMLAGIWIAVVMLVEISVMDAVSVAQTWLSRLLCSHLYTLLVLAHSHSHCADLPMKFHWGSPHFSTSLLSPSSLTPLFISFFPSSSTEGREDLSLSYLLPPYDGRLGDKDYPLTVTEKAPPWRPWPWPLWDKRWGQRKSAAPNTKLENSWWCCLRMFWRCGGMWITATFPVYSLPLPHSLSFFTWLLSEPTANAFEIQDTFPFLVFFLLCPGEFVCAN